MKQDKKFQVSNIKILPPLPIFFRQKDGRKGGRERGREGKRERGKEGKKEGGKEGKKEGRKEGGQAGRQEGREEGEACLPRSNVKKVKRGIGFIVWEE